MNNDSVKAPLSYNFFLQICQRSFVNSQPQFYICLYLNSFDGDR